MEAPQGVKFTGTNRPKKQFLAYYERLLEISFALKSFGLLSGADLLFSIPNRIVKRFSADDSCPATDSENKSRPEDFRAEM